jgi:ribonuclease HI
MTDYTELCALAFQGERVASRRLARRTGVTEEAALRATLEQAAGAAGLAALLGQRQALRLAAQARASVKAERKAAANTLRAARHDGAATPWRAWFDGSAHPNPGRCGIGALLLGPAGERVALSRSAGYGNSSEAEYLALIAVLEAACAAGAQGLTVYGDSQVVINDVTGADSTAAQSLDGLRARARALIEQVGGAALRWIPRHKNGAADALSQAAIAAWSEQTATAFPASALPHRDA